MQKQARLKRMQALQKKYNTATINFELKKVKLYLVTGIHVKK